MEDFYEVRLEVIKPDGERLTGAGHNIPADIMGADTFASSASRLVGSLVFSVRDTLHKI